MMYRDFVKGISNAKFASANLYLTVCVCTLWLLIYALTVSAVGYIVA